MNAYLFKPRRRRRGQIVESRFWSIRYRPDEEQQYKVWPLRVRDKQVAQKRLSDFIREKEWEKDGIIAPKALRDGAARKLLEHLPDYLADLKSRQRDRMYIYNIDRHVRKLVEACGWMYPKDVTPDAFLAWRSQQTAAAKTLNEYLDAIAGLLNWLHRHGRILANPLRCVGRVQTQGNEVRQYRALTDDEMRRLLAVAGPRKAVYLLAWMTGLRRSELRALVWGDLHLDAVRPFLTARASTTKNHKRATIWLREDAVQELRLLRPQIVTDGRAVFGTKVPRMDQFRDDLEAAGIPPADSQGRKVVFHSLRHTLATNLSRAGVAPRVAMEMMRHSDLRLTMKTYTDSTLLPTQDVADRLPRLLAEQLPMAAEVATGTNGKSDTQKDTQKDTKTVVQSCPIVSSNDLSSVVCNSAQAQLQQANTPDLSSVVQPCQTDVENWGSRIRT